MHYFTKMSAANDTNKLNDSHVKSANKQAWLIIERTEYITHLYIVTVNLD